MNVCTHEPPAVCGTARVLPPAENHPTHLASGLAAAAACRRGGPR
jgi:hypothetical protein